jgi:tetratricopeptide (TPR) repeat protein
MLHSQAVAAIPLQEAQPLAYQVLSMVQVACTEVTIPREEKALKSDCEWIGDYAHFTLHALEKHGVVATDGEASQPFLDTPVQSTNHSTTHFLNEVRVEEVQLKPCKGVSSSSAFISPFRDIAPTMVHRSISGDDMPPPRPPTAQKAPLSASSSAPIDGSFGSTKSKKGSSSSGNVKPRRTTTSPPSSVSRSLADSDLEVSYSQALDWNISINSFSGMQSSQNTISDNSLGDCPRPPMGTLNEDQEQTNFQLEFEPETIDELSSRKVFLRAEKLKKQANAKFNKGEFVIARTLYSDGIKVMQYTMTANQEERELLSGMHSNRGVTFFREKKFADCIEDCEKALGYDPSYDKTWIRKWRAHMALGDFDGAYQCLETAHRLIPDSRKILDELTNCKVDKDLLTTARQFLAKKDYDQIREVLRPHVRMSENISLLFLAARADAYVGHTESALEKINKALRFNPMHTEGLELRGHTLFLAGDTEKGAHLLQEALNQNKDNKIINRELSRCQRTHTSFQKGRACVKRGRYAEAVDHFTHAIKDSGNLPQRTPLFGALRTERAEAYLLCNKYVDACKDCQEVINSQPEQATAWSVRADILIALGEAEQAKLELKKIKKSWGFDNPTIGEAYKRVDFELRVRKADDELEILLAELESGRAEPLFADERKSKRQEGHKKNNRSASSIEYEPDLDPRSTDKEKRRHRVRRSLSRNRSRSRGAESARARERSRSNKRGGTPKKSNYVPSSKYDDNEQTPSSRRR